MIAASWPMASKFFSNVTSPTTQDPATLAPSPYVQAQLEKSIGFSELVSYTDSGFDPASTVITQGEAVRFMNNSSGKLWIRSTDAGSAEYPLSGDCEGSTAFDSCYAIPPHEFWEFTFTEPGVWDFQNTLEPSKKGSITVGALEE